METLIRGMQLPQQSTPVQFVVQRRERSKLRRQQIDLSDSTNPQGHASLDELVQWAKHPLPKQDYVDLIRSTHIGALLYDSRTYFSRRAGVLNEYLSSENR